MKNIRSVWLVQEHQNESNIIDWFIWLLYRGGQAQLHQTVTALLQSSLIVQRHQKVQNLARCHILPDAIRP